MNHEVPDYMRRSEPVARWALVGPGQLVHAVYLHREGAESVRQHNERVVLLLEASEVERRVQEEVDRRVRAEIERRTLGWAALDNTGCFNEPCPVKLKKAQKCRLTRGVVRILSDDEGDK